MLMRLVVLAVAAVAIWSWLGRLRGRSAGEGDEEARPGQGVGLAEPPGAASRFSTQAAESAAHTPRATTGRTSAPDETQAAAGPTTRPQAATPATSGSSATAGAGPAGGTAPERRIKGNIRGAEKLYHLPDDETYDQVIEERLFATREEAEAAGYHHAQQPG
ncbi:MAG TPA: hypothetical protein VFD32_09130 [Dehalococcoidia bacterium]|nr:hypothetical protein [Dehalococcoidia bacterium]